MVSRSGMPAITAAECPLRRAAALMRAHTLLAGGQTDRSVCQTGNDSRSVTNITIQTAVK